MRWMWIDQIVEIEPGRRLSAIKNVSLAEEVLHNHFAAGKGMGALPVMPATLLIEGMAQTAGILVGHASGFREKVVLAKITRAKFERDVFPGNTVRFDAVLDRLDEAGASTTGTISVLDHATGETSEVGEVSLLFSHIDRNMAGAKFPEQNFVFTDNFRTLLQAANLI